MQETETAACWPESLEFWRRCASAYANSGRSFTANKRGGRFPVESAEQRFPRCAIGSGLGDFEDFGLRGVDFGATRHRGCRIRLKKSQGAQN